MQIEDYKESLAITVKAARIESEMTQRELAESVGISMDTISRLEQAKRGVSMKNVMRVLRYFNIGVAFTWEGGDDSELL